MCLLNCALTISTEKTVNDKLSRGKLTFYSLVENIAQEYFEEYRQ